MCLSPNHAVLGDGMGETVHRHCMAHMFYSCIWVRVSFLGTIILKVREVGGSTEQTWELLLTVFDGMSCSSKHNKYTLC